MRDRTRTNRYNGTSERRARASVLAGSGRGLTLLLLATALAVAGCQSARSAPEASPPPTAEQKRAAATGQAEGGAAETRPRVPLRWVNYELNSPTLGPIPALVRVPVHTASTRLPALVLLHGRGEAQKSPKRGARGFVDDYGLEAVWQWLDGKPGARTPPPGLPSRYRQGVEADLDRAPFSAMVLVMPYLPDRFRGSEAFVNAPEYARQITELVTRIKADLPVRQDRGGWALDGISLGGRVAMVCMAELTPHFAAFGSVQAAIDERELTVFADVLARARTLDANLRFTLATSDQDYFRLVLEHYRAALIARSLEHEWVVLPGDHSYAFNRGPGVTHLLLTYDRWFHQRR